MSRAAAVVALALLASAVSSVAREVIVDDFDRNQIIFQPTGAWTSQGGDAATRDRYMGTTTWTSTVGASATFTFTGTSITFISYGDLSVPYESRGESAFDVNLDGKHYVANTYSDSNEAQAQKSVFSQDGLDGTIQHTIVITKTQNNSRQINVDAFLYTVNDSPSGSASQSSSGAPTSTPDSGNQVPVAAIAGGVVGAVVVGVALGFLVWYLRNRSKPQVVNQTIIYTQSGQPHTPYTPSTHGASSLGPGYSPYAALPSPYSASSHRRNNSSDPLNMRQDAISPVSFAHTTSSASSPLHEFRNITVARSHSLAFSDPYNNGRESVLPPYPMTPAPITMTPAPAIRSPLPPNAEDQSTLKSPIPLG